MNTEKKEVVKKEKKPKIKLVTYSVKATIPVGQYANICPEVTVQAVNIETAERAVMPHIEAMFTKYREGVPTPKPQTVIEKIEYTAPVTGTPIPLSAPFTRAKSAIDNATTLDAIDLLQSQVEKSVKLVQSEKDELLKLLVVKATELKNVKTNSTQRETVVQSDDSVANQ